MQIGLYHSFYYKWKTPLRKGIQIRAIQTKPTRDLTRVDSSQDGTLPGTFCPSACLFGARGTADRRVEAQGVRGPEELPFS